MVCCVGLPDYEQIYLRNNVSLPPEDLSSMAKNAGVTHGKHAAGYDLSTQRSPNNASETADYTQLSIESNI